MNEKRITEDDIAAYLLSTPGFFERQADLLSNIQLSSPHGNRAVSLQERQMELLREKAKGLELHLASMIRAGSDNDQIHQRLLGWTLGLLGEREESKLPEAIVQGLEKNFSVPQVALRVWGADGIEPSSVYAEPITTDVQTFIKGMGGEPYCGSNPNLEVVNWLKNVEEVRSIALIPLYQNSFYQTFGVIVLGSPDERRFTADMGVEILKSMGAIASAALMRCMKE